MLLLTKHLGDHSTILLQVSTPSLAIGLVLHKALATWIEQEPRENLELTIQERYKVQDNNYHSGTDHLRSRRLSLSVKNYQHNKLDQLERSLRPDNLDHHNHWLGNAALWQETHS